MKPQKDNTRRRQSRRQAALDEAARAAGWASWSEYATAVKNGTAKMPRKKNSP